MAVGDNFENAFNIATMGQDFVNASSLIKTAENGNAGQNFDNAIAALSLTSALAGLTNSSYGTSKKFALDQAIATASVIQMFNNIDKGNYHSAISNFFTAISASAEMAGQMTGTEAGKKAFKTISITMSAAGNIAGYGDKIADGIHKAHGVAVDWTSNTMMGAENAFNNARTAVTEAVSNVHKTGSEAIGNAANGANYARNAVSEAVSNAMNAGSQAVQATIDFGKEVANSVANAAQELANAALDFGREVANKAKDIANQIGDWYDKAVDKLIDKADQAYQKLKDGIEKAIDKAKEVANDAKQKAKELAEDIGNKWDKAKDKFKQQLEDLKDKILDQVDDWKDKLDKAKDWFDKPNRQGKHYFYDPIVLDLDGDGIETLAHNKNKGAMFDFDADGLKHATGWVKSDDGILVFDRNADGFVNDGREVFGDSTLKADGSLAKHGFDALADLDTNADGYINQDDDAYKLLKVWQDKNQDGISQADELKTLEELNIQSLNLSYQDTKQNLNGGNELAQIGSYTKTNGTTFKMGDVNFKFDSLYSKHSLAVNITDVEIAFLPNLAGGGRVRSLHEAMQLSAELKEIVVQYAQATTKQAQLELLPSLLKAWAKTDPEYQDLKVPDFWESLRTNDGTGVAVAGNPNTVTFSFDNMEIIRKKYKGIAYKVGVLDSFLGTKTDALYYISEKHAQETVDIINQTYEQLSTAIYSGLYGQGGVFNHYNQYVQLHISFDDEQNIQYQLNFAPLIEHFQQKIATGDEQQLKATFVDLVEYINYFQKQKVLQQYDIKDVLILLAEFSENINTEQQTEWLNAVNPHILKQGFIKFGTDTNDNVTASIVIAKNGNDHVYGTQQNDFLLAGHGNDHIEARQGDDYIDGGDGNDTLYGQDGSDTLIGSTGNDHLDGGYSADSYIFSKGHGQDTIHDYDWTAPNGQRPQDKIIFTDVRSDEIQIELNGGNLILKGYHEQDQITLRNFTHGSDYHIEQFEFVDKTVSLTELLSEHKISGTSNNDHLSFDNWNVNINLDSGHGNDTLIGGNRHDTLHAGLGNDHVEAKQGDDYIDGGDGNDTLYGQDGSDTLIGSTGNDHLDGGYSADSYIFSKGHGQDTIHDYDWTAPNGQRPQDKIIFTDVRSDEIQIELNGGNLILKGYHEQDQITLRNFTHGSDYHIEQFEFVDKTVSLTELLSEHKISGTSNNDHLSFDNWNVNINLDSGHGNDTLIGGNRHDTLHAGLGNDHVEAKQGDDYIDGGDGNDTLYGQDGSDTLIGGTGNDHLDGGYSTDSYIFSKGHGQDTIHDYDWTAPNGQRPQDKIIFTDVRSDEIQIELNGGNLILKGYHEQDQITLRNFTHGSDYHIEQFEFVDKTVSFSELMNLVTATHQGTEQGTTQHTHQWLGKVEANLADGNDEFNSGERGLGVIVDGGTGNDRIYTRNANDTIYGGADNDYVEAKQGDDYIDGGDGNDTLYGQDGSDTLIGGTGNDHLDGGYSTDSYIFSKGHGQDTIHDYDWTAPNGQRPQDKIIFTDVRSDEIQIELNGGNLILKGYHEQDQINLRNFTHGSDYHIEQFEFVDKTVSFSELMNLVTATHQGTEQGTTQHTHQWLGKVEANLADGNDEFNSGERGLGVIVDGGTGNDRIYTRNANDTIYGGADNDYVEAKQGDDYIDGGDGNDTLYGQDGSDTLIGGTGNDHLDGGYSTDSYIFSKGHGQDTIHDYDWTAPNGQRPQDKIIFTDVRSDEIQIELNGGNLILKGYHEQDQINLRNFTHGSDYHIEQFEFVDKTVSFSELMNLVTATHQGTEQGTTQHTHQWLGKVEANLADGNDEFNSGERGLGVIVDGGTGNDRIYTRNANDTIYGGAGNDYVEAKQGDDYIDGGDGNDTLYGQDGSDTLIGGTGNDHLDGGYSADSYIFSKGHGQDTIHDYDWTAPNGQRPQDKIIFTDVRSDEIQIELNGGNLILKGYHEQDQINLRNFTHGSDYHIEQFEFVDKTVSFSELMNLVTATHQGTEQGTTQHTHQWLGKVEANLADGNDEFNSGERGLGVIVDGGTGNDRIYTRNANDTIYGGAGNDYVEAKQGDDYIDGGDGNDTLYGQDGSDTLIGGTGNDHLDGGYSADSYIFSKGHGQDTIHDYDWTAPNGQRPQDKIIFTDVRSDEIQIELNGGNLILKGYHEQDQITLRNFTHGSDYHIEQFEFVDKTVSLTELLSEHKISGTSNNDHLSFSNWNINVSLDGGDGNDSLYGGQLNDTLIGGLGNDYLYGGNGADTAVLQMLDLTHHHIDYFADFNLKQGDKLDIRDLLEQPNQTIDLSNLSDYFSTEKTNDGMVLKFDQDGQYQDQHQSQAIMRFQSNAFDSLDQLIQANSFIL